jgi:hypothetical protein
LKITATISLLLILLFSSRIAAQSGIADCGTTLPPNYSNWKTSVSSVQNLVSALKHDTCLNKKFSIVFYIIADSLGGWGGLFQPNLDTCIAKLNRNFAPICVSFMNCSTVVIPNHTFNYWDMPFSETLVVPNWHADNTINLYLPASITGTPTGYAYFPSSGKDVIVVEKSAITTLTPVHEMGHFFGLPHTHDEIGGSVVPPPPAGVASYEFVARTNCYLHGDGFCDTESDCFPQPLGTKDGFNEYYVRPIDNIMSYHGSTRCRFTQEQYNFMARAILTQRLSLH